MGLEDILKNIESDTKAKVRQTVDQSISDAQVIADQAAAQADKIMKDSRAKAEMDAKQLQARELSRANIEAKNTYQNSVNKALGESFKAIQDGLWDYVNTDDYAKLLNKLAAMAISELGDGCTLVVQKKDIPKLKLRGNAKVEASDKEFVGGVIGVSANGMMSVDYSLEKVLDGMKDGIAVKLLDLIKG